MTEVNPLNLEAEICDPLSRESWDEEILSFQGPGFFHTREWAAVLYETYRYRPAYLRLHRSGRPVGLLPIMDVRRFPTPRRGVSLPFTDHCDPLFSGIAFRSLFDAAVEAGRERSWRLLETRTTWDPFDTGRPHESYLGHVLDLTAGEDRIFSGFSGATRRNLRKAGREGIEVSIGNSWRDTAEYYRLHCLTRKRHGVPPQPLKFFKKIHEHVILKHYGAVFLARRGERAAAGAVFFHFHDGVLYKFGASDPALQEFRAANGVMGEAIRHYAGEGFRSLCFGRTEPWNEGLRRFKLGWGTTERTIHYHRFGIPEKAFLPGEEPRRPRWGRLFRRLPVPVLRLIGTAAYGFMA
jgi:hypothetical protein